MVEPLLSEHACWARSAEIIKNLMNRTGILRQHNMEIHSIPETLPGSQLNNVTGL